MTAAPLTRDDLLPLERYAAERPAWRTRLIHHKKTRSVMLGDHITLLFEDRLTIQYQVQEMLRAERIFEAAGIEDELNTYNPLIPDGGNWKATMLIEYSDVAERQRMLARLKGIERRVWVQAGEGPRIYAIADEDLGRENEEKTSAVHFLRFELDASQRATLRAGAALNMGVDHHDYSARLTVSDATRTALLADLTD
jgi:hypothetical protein